MAPSCPLPPGLSALTEYRSPLLESHEFVETGYYSVDDAGPVACATSPGAVAGADVPEAGIAVLLPLLGLAVGGVLLMRRRRTA